MSYNINRIIDANINRAKEGLRVTEEISRFILNSKAFSAGLKKIRHDLDGLSARFAPELKSLLKERDAACDVGADISAGELKRKDIRDIFFANMQRVKESIRVLEEFAKLKEAGLSLKFKRMRYRLYVIEARIGRKL